MVPMVGVVRTAVVDSWTNGGVVAWNLVVPSINSGVVGGFVLCSTNVGVVGGLVGWFNTSRGVVRGAAVVLPSNVGVALCGGLVLPIVGVALAGAAVV